ncbi:MAG: aminoacyl-tRNA hydrolase [Thermodesulfobacteriota bacterium]|nr:aminoacyl-tRNA hydrolase [Thermodesulfobacteriota bacterium]
MTARLRLIVGLGNPGGEYENTRHNAGFMTVDHIAQTFSISLDKRKFNTAFGKGLIEGVDVILAKPMAFMNKSGPPVQNLAGYFRILYKDMLVIHDDIDLDFGRIKIIEKGGHGGHNGVRSLMDAFGGGDFSRIRIGIGRSGTGADVTGHVLGKYSADESKVLDQIIINARNAAVTILCKGIKDGMNRFNNKRTVLTS